MKATLDIDGNEIIITHWSADETKERCTEGQLTPLLSKFAEAFVEIIEKELGG